MIQAYVGLPGTGKTFSMVADAYPLIRSGMRVFSNFPIRWSERGREYKSIFLNPVDILEAVKNEANASFLIDEMNIVFSSYDDARLLDRGLLNRFAQGRKANADFYFTSQRFHHSMKRVRDLTNIVIDCRKIRFLTFTFFRNVYYNPTIFDREHLFDTPLEQKYIMGRRLIFPWQLKGIYRKYPTEFMIQSKTEFLKLRQGAERPDNFPSISLQKPIDGEIKRIQL